MPVQGYIESMLVASEGRKAHVAVVQDPAQHALVQVHVSDVFCVDRLMCWAMIPWHSSTWSPVIE